jgi:hypothetical protein
MISFTRLGKAQGLGNQMFQYAFLRTTAQRLGVTFFCPAWKGERIFQLKDEAVRVREPLSIDKKYCQPKDTSGFSPSALRIEDGTEIFGFFQSEKYFDGAQVRRWFTFRDEVIARVREKYQRIDFSRSAGVHLRFGDMKRNPMFVILPLRFYTRAISFLKNKERILVFSDEIDTAREYLQGLKGDLFFIEGNADYEDLYLMTRCRGFVCSVSTFSWWGAWLNENPDKIIVAPREWIRPGHPWRSSDLQCPGWIMLRGCRPLVDNYRFLMKKKEFGERIFRMRTRSIKENLFALKNYLKRKMWTSANKGY